MEAETALFRAYVPDAEGVSLEPGADRLSCDVISARKELQCEICKYIMDNPMLLGCCGQHLCEKCVTSIQQSNISGVRCCPFCRSEQFTTLLHRGLLREVNGLRARCPNSSAGCCWQGELKRVVEHIHPSVTASSVLVCQYQMVKCKFPGCATKLLRRNLYTHEKELCEFRDFTCKFCLDVTNTYHEVVKNHYPICPEYPVPCPNNCSTEMVCRSAVAEHLSTTCPLQEVACDYLPAGCHVRGPRRDMDVHCKNASGLHSKLLVEQNTTLQTKLLESHQHFLGSIQKLEEQNTRFEKILRDQDVKYQRQLSSLENRIVEMASEIKRQQSASSGAATAAVAATAAATEELKDRMTALQKQVVTEVSGITSELYMVKDSQDVHKNAVAKLESQVEGIDGKCAQLTNSLDIMQVSLQVSQSDNMESLVVRHLEPTLTALEELRLDVTGNQTLARGVQKDVQYIEKCFTPQPPFAFTVSRFPERKFNKEPFVSPWFYTHPRGYKLCMRVDVYGVDNHIAVRSCVMKGEHDEHLNWPFRGDIHVRIQNQLGDHTHYVKIISYDETTAENKCGRVLTGDKNYLHGFSQFISYVALGLDQTNKCQYLKGEAVDFEVTKVQLK